MLDLLMAQTPLKKLSKDLNLIYLLQSQQSKKKKVC